ncbi:hypothetical protein P1J78_25125, partial [Psychromarinibacter sp. C21-152]
MLRSGSRFRELANPGEHTIQAVPGMRRVNLELWMKVPLGGCVPRRRHRRSAAFGMAEGVVLGQTYMV